MKQAVIVIHGVGEQRPLETLRILIRNISKGKKIYSKPDFISENLELRRFQLAGDRYQLPTDFYEFYWAHHMRDTSPRMIFSWLRALLSKGGSARRGLRMLFYLTRFLLLAVSTYGLFWFYSHELALDTEIEKSGLLVFTAALLFLASFLRMTYETVGKAARYLTPSPDNIEQRNRIREEGVALLDKLHKCEKYHRIIIVGHSLGSVIAYDIIRHYWSREIYPGKEKINPQLVNPQSFRKYKTAIKDLKLNKITAREFQSIQQTLWKEFRNMSLPWLVTDLITIGSPLSHAKLLLADSEREFVERIEGSEYPTCPPIKSDDNKSWIRLNYDFDAAKRSTWFPTHDHVFSCVRWTNIYFEHKYIFWGDPIGGPVSDVFGKGIIDVNVGKTFRYLWSCHTKYWDKAGKENRDTNQLTELIKALKLPSEHC